MCTTRLALNKALRQTTDRWVLISDGGIQGGVQQVFQLTRQHNNIARGKAKGLHCLVIRNFLHRNTRGADNPITEPGANLFNGHLLIRRLALFHIEASAFQLDYNLNLKNIKTIRLNQNEAEENRHPDVYRYSTFERFIPRSEAIFSRRICKPIASTANCNSLQGQSARWNL